MATGIIERPQTRVFQRRLGAADRCWKPYKSAPSADPIPWRSPSYQRPYFFIRE